MREIRRTRFGGPDVLEIREMPEPEPKASHAVIQVKAFGINTPRCTCATEWAETAAVSGIVKSCPGGVFAPGTEVAALVGGLVRTINGIYAEYTRAPVTTRGSTDVTVNLA
jgi:NADPH:quinone reductase-like Zn-dependent oxidoreductase